MTDIFIHSALVDDPVKGGRLYGPVFDEWLELIRGGGIMEKAVPAFASVNFCALHKDTSNPDKLRPLGAGSAARMFSESFISYYFQCKIVKIILPQNYCVGVKGGYHVIAYTTMLEIDK